MKYIKPNGQRGGFAFAGLVCLAVGSAILWGIGGAILSIGIYLTIDTILDNITERFTMTTNWKIKE